MVHIQTTTDFKEYHLEPLPPWTPACSISLLSFEGHSHLVQICCPYVSRLELWANLILPLGSWPWAAIYPWPSALYRDLEMRKNHYQGITSHSTLGPFPGQSGQWGPFPSSEIIVEQVQGRGACLPSAKLEAEYRHIVCLLWTWLVLYSEGNSIQLIVLKCASGSGCSIDVTGVMEPRENIQSMELKNLGSFWWHGDSYLRQGNWISEVLRDCPLN